MLEGQGFASSIFDTQDLSTIRGGSLLMRDLVISADKFLKLRWPDKVTEATRGGSIGIWRLDVAEDQAATGADELRTLLSRDYAHQAFGFAVLADDGGSYSRQRNRLRAVLQRQRLSQARLAYPSLVRTERRVCPVDLVRPVAQGTRQRIGPGDEGVIFTSQSVYDRRRFGMAKKQSLIAEETALAINLSPEAAAWLQRPGRPFAMQINSISEGAAMPEGLKATLADKICVIALDGNGFGKVQDDALAAKDKDTIETQQAFDAGLARLRSSLIARVFSRLIESGGVGAPSEVERQVREALHEPQVDTVARFELLLWGGDEIMFIVPARLGWDILQTIAAETYTLLGQTVTFAVGAVFCHHDAPIARIKELADNLATHIKGLEKVDGKGRDGKAETLVMVEVLESFDHVGTDLAAHLQRRVPKPTTTELDAAERMAFRVLDQSDLKGFQAAAVALAAGIGGRVSRGRLRQVAQALHAGAAPGAVYRGGNWKSFVADTAHLLSGEAAAVAGVTQSGPEQVQTRNSAKLDRYFTLLEDYWDYLVPVARNTAEAAA